jgi:hypothetical protein
LKEAAAEAGHAGSPLPVLIPRWAYSLALSIVLIAAVLAVTIGLSGRTGIDASLVDQELVQSFVQDNKDTVLAFAYSPNGQTEFQLFEEFYEYVVEQTGSEEDKLLKANYQYLVGNIDGFI